MHLKEIKNPVAFFSAEFAIDNELPTYSGGLGILAGDLINQAAIEHYPFIGISILYKGKEFMQHITSEGKAETRDSEFDHDTSFLRVTTKNGKPLVFTINTNSEVVKVKSYHVRLSDTAILFFLSADLDGNPPEWTSDMDALYRGNSESQIRQQILLGVGGVRLLNELDIKPRVYHINEGRPEFIIWQMTRDIMKAKSVGFEEAWNHAKEKIVYTNHTLVTAGNLLHPIELVKKYSSDFANEMNIDNNLLVKDGAAEGGLFNTTLFALNTSIKISAVSRVHAELAKHDWPNYEWNYVTNGVYLPRWQDSDFRVTNITDESIWEQHKIKKHELVKTVVNRTGFGYDPNRLVITWARRLAEYKQPKMIFSDIAKLKKIISNPNGPVQILFAGNSHTGDTVSKSIIEDIIKIFTNDLSGYAIFIPNYNIALANHLTSGSDIWLNTPKGNLEACGTSGMKAISNGVINCTVIDGWTNEVDWTDTGWVLDPNNIADHFYETLEKEIIPAYFDRDSRGLPIKWISMMRKSIILADEFSAERMLNEYKKKMYNDE